MLKVLVVDDDSEAVISLTRALKASGLDATMNGAGSAEKALEIIGSERPSVVILDLSLNDKEGVESGYRVLRETTALDESIRVIVLTGHGGAQFGIKALELGAAHFLQKPADIPHLRALVKDSLAQSKLRRDYRDLAHQQQTHDESRIIGASPTTQKLREEIAYASYSNQAVLLTGETGCGKGLCAYEIHRLSKRAPGKFVRYQTSFSTPDLVASDLFGHTKGSFTGASDDRRGLIAEADRGTLFLDEIDQLPLETQVSLLGVLQEKAFRPVGSNKVIQSDFRLISATNADLEHHTNEGKFRKDLFHRVAHFTIRIPPLRSRMEDIPLIVEKFLDTMRAKERIQVFSITQSALQRLSDYAWPGNVRELEAVIEGAAYRAEYFSRRTIEADDLSLGSSTAAPSTTRSFHDQVEAFKLKLVNDALSATGGNQVKAAALLSLDRTSLRRILTRS